MNKKIFNRLIALCLGTFLLASCGTNPTWMGFQDRDTQAWGGDDGIEDENKTTPRIFIEHGLGHGPNNVRTIRDGLSRRLAGHVDIIVPNERDTYASDILTQSRRLVQTIQGQVELTDPIVLVGQSQGGLRAYQAALTLRQNGYNVVGVVTIGTPWEGVALLEEQKRNTALMMLGMAAMFTGGLDQRLTQQITALTNVNNRGVSDMIPGSNFLITLNQSMRQATNIPLLTIGGDARRLIQNNPIAGVLLGLTKFDTGQTSDLLIPLESQLASSSQVAHKQTATFNAVHTPELATPLGIAGNTELNHGGIMDSVRDFIVQQIPEAGRN